jgi:quinolinate synthase
MKLNTMEKLYRCMLYEQPEIILDADTIERAKKPINRMLDISRKLNLIK